MGERTVTTLTTLKQLTQTQPRSTNQPLPQRVSRPPHPVVAEQGAEVGRLLLVHQLHEAGAVDGVDGGEDAAGEEAQLQELGDRSEEHTSELQSR